MPVVQDKHTRFIEAYVRCINATQAAIEAGYSKKTANVQGSTLLTNPKIRKEIEERLSKYADRVGVNTTWMIDNLKTTVEQCLQKKPILDKDGVTQIYKYDPSNANKSLELLGKHIGFFEQDNSQKTGEVAKVIREWLDS